MEANVVLVTLHDAEAEYAPLSAFEAEVRHWGDDLVTLVTSTDGLDSARELLRRLWESAIYPSAKVKLRKDESVWVTRVVSDGPNRLGHYRDRDGRERCTVMFAVRVIEPET